MPVYRLSEEPLFPDPRLADPEGLLAVGGDLSARRLLNGYCSGIFPWYSEGDPILWWSPDPRVVLEPAAVHVPRSLRKTVRRGRYQVNFDTRFGEVIAACAASPRPDQDGTWISDEMVLAYERLHRLGHAHSAEAFEDGELVGGLYGVALGGIFFGESMFTRRQDASKVAFVTLLEQLVHWGFELVDCQLHTDHLARFGALEMDRELFLSRLQDCLRLPGRRGSWTRLES